MTPDQIEAERVAFSSVLAKLGRTGEVEWEDGKPVWTSDRADWVLWLAAVESIRERQAAEETIERHGRHWPSGERAE